MAVVTLEGIQRVAAALQGTQQPLEHALADEFGNGTMLEDVPPELMEYLDDQLAQCEDCNCWIDPGERNDEGVCHDCRS